LHLNLRPVVASIAVDMGIKVAKVIGEKSEEQMTSFSSWLLLTNNDSFLANIESLENVELLDPKITLLWTDEYSNLLSVLR